MCCQLRSPGICNPFGFETVPDRSALYGAFWGDLVGTKIGYFNQVGKMF